MQRQKRIAAVHDISCLGRCSLTVCLPIVSAAGVEVGVIPTAVLSTHTGGFTGYTYRDLTEDILPIVRHWVSLGNRFDAIYTGYLGSFEQLDIVAGLFDTFRREDNLILVDPVMADNGKLYSTFSPEFPKGMARLCGKADVIVPNMTEACLLVERPYREGPYSPEYIESILYALAELGPKKIVLTGVCFDEKRLGTATLDSSSGRIAYTLSERIEGSYHGTGDVFASALLAALLNDFDLDAAARIAVDFTCGCILRTREAGTDIRYGVNFEDGLPGLLHALGKI